MKKKASIKLPDIRQRIVEVRPVRAADLEPHPGNWRDHPDAQAEAMAGVLSEVGDVGVLLAWKSERNGGKLTLIDGHMRRDIAPDHEYMVAVTDLSDAEADYVLATHDPLAAMAQADAARLDALLSSVNSSEAGVQKMLADLAKEAGIFEAEIGQDNDEPDEDEAEALRVKWGVECGQLWQLGEHRLLCGDSFDAPSRDRVIAGAAPALMFADPPFDMDYTDIAVPDSVNTAVVLGRGSRRLAWELAHFGSWGHHEIVFTGGVRGWPRDELPCLMHDSLHVWRSPKAHTTFDVAYLSRGNIETTKDKKRPLSVQGHSGGVLDGQAMGMSWAKPKLWYLLSACYIRRGEVIYDPFAGSGSVFLAGQEYDRRVVGIELNPAWVALSLQRFSDAYPDIPVGVSDAA